MFRVWIVIVFNRKLTMASGTIESKGDVITIVADDFDKVGYTKTDEADMAKQSKQQQFHVRQSSVIFLVLLDR